jgi:hypothetical protein
MTAKQDIALLSVLAQLVTIDSIWLLRTASLPMVAPIQRLIEDR